MAVTLDLMEYADDAAAQAAYVASDAEVVDQNYEADGDGASAVGDTGGVEHWYAVKFTTGAAIFCSAASIYLEGQTGNPTGDMTFRIETNVSSKPSGILVHANAAGTLTPTQPAWKKCDFAPFELAAGTYWLVIYIPDQANDNKWHWTRDESGGTNETAYSQDHASSWGFVAAARSYYRIHALHCQCYSESAIKEQGSYSLKGIAVITVSLNDTLTRTVGPTIDLTGMLRVYLDIRASRTGSNIKIGIHDSGGTTTEVTPNIASANVFQEVALDISGVADGDKDDIDSIIITVVNADATNTFYIDDMYGEYIEVSKERDIVYDIITYIERARSIVYDSILELTRERSIVYDQVLSLSRELDVVYDSILELSRERNVVYDIITYIEKSRDIVYDSILELSEDRNILYDLVLNVSAESRILYDLIRLIQRLEVIGDGWVKEDRPAGVSTREDAPTGVWTKLPEV